MPLTHDLVPSPAAHLITNRVVRLRMPTRHKEPTAASLTYSIAYTAAILHTEDIIFPQARGDHSVLLPRPRETLRVFFDAMRVLQTIHLPKVNFKRYGL